MIGYKCDHTIILKFPVEMMSRDIDSNLTSYTLPFRFLFRVRTSYIYVLAGGELTFNLLANSSLEEATVL